MSTKVLSVKCLADGNPTIYRAAVNLLASGWTEPNRYVKSSSELRHAGLSLRDLVALGGVHSPDGREIWRVVETVMGPDREGNVWFFLLYRLVP